MAYNLIFTDAFEKDLDSILDYIINKLYNPTAAARLYKNVKSTFAKITELPEMYPLHPLKRLSEKGFRFCQVGNYLMFYTIDHEHKIIYARAMVYGAMDLTKVPDLS